MAALGPSAPEVGGSQEQPLRVGLSRSLGSNGDQWSRRTANGFTGWIAAVRFGYFGAQAKGYHSDGESAGAAIESASQRRRKRRSWGRVAGAAANSCW